MALVNKSLIGPSLTISLVVKLIPLVDSEIVVPSRLAKVIRFSSSSPLYPYGMTTAGLISRIIRDIVPEGNVLLGSVGHRIICEPPNKSFPGPFNTFVSPLRIPIANPST